jgi:hypothetical protein
MICTYVGICGPPLELVGSLWYNNSRLLQQWISCLDCCIFFALKPESLVLEMSFVHFSMGELLNEGEVSCGSLSICQVITRKQINAPCLEVQLATFSASLSSVVVEVRLRAA